MDSSAETHLTEQAVSCGGLWKRLVVDKPSDKGLRQLHLPAKHPETCPVSVCSCWTQAARGDAIPAAQLSLPEALELSCSWCRHDPTGRYGSHANVRREETDLSFRTPKAGTRSAKGQRKQTEKTYFQHCFVVWGWCSSRPQSKFAGISFNMFSHTQFWGLVWRRDDERLHIYEASWVQKTLGL